MSSKVESLLPICDSHDDVVIADNVSKSYALYRRASERLIHLLMPWRIYPRFEALKGVSFSVARGETVGIIGQNGAGKSTLLQLVTGTVPPTSGNIMVKGRIAALLELGAGFEPDFTGRENILLNGTILGLSEDLLHERMDEIIAFSELGEFIDRAVRIYSSGMFMRLAFSVAAHVDAEILIIDEALAVGDARFTQKCMRYLKDFKKKGSILFVSHDVGAITGLCDRAIWLDHGLIRSEGESVHVCEQYLASLFDQSADTSDPNPVITKLKNETGKYQGKSQEQHVLLTHSALPSESEPVVTSCSAFNPTASAFGSGGAQIIDAGIFESETQARLAQVSEGQEVDLRIIVEAHTPIKQPIFGFYIKDRLGQFLLGENTFWEDVSQTAIADGERAGARFRFKWPALAKGSYALTVAIADGTMADHIQRHWMHDAMVFTVLSSSARRALVGLDMSLVAIDHRLSGDQ